MIIYYTFYGMQNLIYIVRKVKENFRHFFFVTTETWNILKKKIFRLFTRNIFTDIFVFANKQDV